MPSPTSSPPSNGANVVEENDDVNNTNNRSPMSKLLGVTKSPARENSTDTEEEDAAERELQDSIDSEEESSSAERAQSKSPDEQVAITNGDKANSENKDVADGRGGGRVVNLAEEAQKVESFHLKRKLKVVNVNADAVRIVTSAKSNAAAATGPCSEEADVIGDVDVNEVLRRGGEPRMRPVRASTDVLALKAVVEDLFVEAVSIRDTVTINAEKKMYEEVKKPELPSGSRFFGSAYASMKSVRVIHKAASRIHRKTLRDEGWIGRFYDFYIRLCLIAFYGLLSVIETVNNIIDFLVPDSVRKFVDDLDRRIGQFFRRVDAWLSDLLHKLLKRLPILTLTPKEAPQYLYNSAKNFLENYDENMEHYFPWSHKAIYYASYPTRKIAGTTWSVFGPYARPYLIEPVAKRVNIVL